MAGSLRVAIEGPATTLWRAAILYLEHFEAFLRISWRAAAPAIVLLIVLAFPAWKVDPVLFSIIPAAIWGIVTCATHSSFAAVVDRLRRRPLESVEVNGVFARLNRRLGLDEDTGIFRAIPSILVFYIQCELRAPAGHGDLAFQIAFHEGLAPGEVKDRCALLAGSTKKAYGRLRLIILGSVFVPPVVLFLLLCSIGMLAGFDRDDMALGAFKIAMLGLPLIAVFLNPVLSPALAILYFRSRQANGEDVVLPISRRSGF